jgi:hypothetical protein
MKYGLTQWFTVKECLEFQTKYIKTFPYAVFGGAKATHILVACTCEEHGGGTHLAAIRNTPDTIKSHKDQESILKELRDEGS